MEQPAALLTAVGAILLLGLVADALSGYTRLPQVTLLMILGFLAGPGGIGLLPADGGWFTVVADMALVMVGFLLGEHFTASNLRRVGRAVVILSVVVVLVTALVVCVGLVLLGTPLPLALLLGGLSTSTAPAATLQVVQEVKAEGPFARLLLGIVAVDDAWGLILFSGLLALAALAAGNGEAGVQLLAGTWEVAGAVGLGLLLGVPAAYLTGRLDPGKPTLVEALGIVFLCGGVALWLGVSFLLASMVLGATVANLARHHDRPFHAIEGIEWPFMVLFFVLAGASLEVAALPAIGLVGGAYVLLRVGGRLAGAWLGGRLSGVDGVVRRWMGLALLPQAGVALGMALVAAARFPDLRDTILPVAIGATVLFELFGPVLTKLVLTRAGEGGRPKEEG